MQERLAKHYRDSSLKNNANETVINFVQVDPITEVGLEIII